MEALSKITWRRFFVLLTGLSPDSMFWMVNLQKHKGGNSRMITDPKQAEKAIDRIWGL